MTKNNNIIPPLVRLGRIADPDIRKKAIKNFNAVHYAKHIESDVGLHVADAISCGFSWAKTPKGQGLNYWNRIWKLALKGELKLLPEQSEGEQTENNFMKPLTIEEKLQFIERLKELCFEKYYNKILLQDYVYHSFGSGECGDDKFDDDILSFEKCVKENKPRRPLEDIKSYQELEEDSKKFREFVIKFISHIENNIINNVYSADELMLLIPFVNLKDQAKELLTQLEK